jgi:hypothetical protein
MKPEDLEYVTKWLDYYQFGKSSQDGTVDAGEIIGHHKEFQEQQLSGASEFQLPLKK